MGDNGRQPLSRRVPGATDMPKAQLRRQPPKLPDHVVERLRAEVSAARAKAEEQSHAQPAEQAEVSPQQPRETVTSHRPNNPQSRRFPRNLDAPEPTETREAPEVPYGTVTAQPAANFEVAGPPRRTASPRRAAGLKGVAAPQPAAAIEVPQLPRRAVPQQPTGDIEVPQLPKRAVAPRTAATVEVPELPNTALAPQPAPTVEVPQLPERIVAPKAPRHADTPLPAEHVAASPSPPEPWPVVDDNTEPIPVVRPAMHSASMVMDRESNSQTDILDRRAGHVVQPEKADLPDGSRRRDHGNPSDVATQPDNDSANGRTISLRLAAPAVDHDPAFRSTAARPRPRRRLSSFAAAPRSSARRQPTALQALFMETDPFEEIVASARAQADGRRTGLEWRYRMVSLIVTALVVLAILVFLATR